MNVGAMKERMKREAAEWIAEREAKMKRARRLRSCLACSGDRVDSVGDPCVGCMKRDAHPASPHVVPIVGFGREERK